VNHIGIDGDGAIRDRLGDDHGAFAVGGSGDQIDEPSMILRGLTSSRRRLTLLAVSQEIGVRL